jgi:hypothetical protein
MADHTHRILRNIKRTVTSDSYEVLLSEPGSSFFGAGTIAGVDKWVAYGLVEAVLLRLSTGGDGQRYTFLLHRNQASSTIVLVAGALQDQVGVLDQFVSVDVDGSNNFRILGRSHDADPAIISVTLDLHFICHTYT